ncbi:MAG TPA: helix-turn-helix domain-containing protein [Gammaproteobacteria bacterium]|nr:helix-turn-helix domain-containing protein [Gammaproteobacteria bacterium]
MTKGGSTKTSKLGQRLIKGVREIKSGGGKRYKVAMPTGVRLVRARMGLTQKEFAARLNISLRTLQEWEQGSRKPSGAAVALLDIAFHHPKIFLHRDPDNHTPRAW